MCGQSLAVTPSPPDAMVKRTESLLFRVFGGVSWLMIAVGTFIVALGYLGVIDSFTSYYADPTEDFRTIGYGIAVYGIAAIFVAMNRFFKHH